MLTCALKAQVNDLNIEIFIEMCALYLIFNFLIN